MTRDHDDLASVIDRLDIECSLAEQTCHFLVRVDAGDLRIALRALTEAPSPSGALAGGWRPIESAPRDGTHFLACDARQPYGPAWTFDQRPPTVVHWWGGPLEQMSAPDAGFYTSVNEQEPERPFPATHWRSLPAAPVHSAGAAS